MNSMPAKEQLGRNATIIWLTVSIILFVADGGVNNCAAAFLFIGMFIAAIVAGGVSYWILKKQAVYLANKYGNPETNEAKKMQLIGGYVFYAMHLAICVLFVVWCYASFYWT